MKSLKHALLFITLSLSIAIGLSACISTGGFVAQTPQQRFAQFCMSADAINKIVLGLPGASAEDIKNVTTAQGILYSVCSSGVTLTPLNLNTLVTEGLPLLVTVVNALPATTPNLALLKIDVDAAAVIVPELIATLQAPIPATK